MSTTYTFPCGCEFPLLEETTPEGVVPFVDIDIETVRDDCPATWALLGRGLTKGVFQLESSLGRTWTKKLRPDNMEHIAALGAILRPGALKAFDQDGVSATQHYCLRKNGEEEVKGYHPAIDPILATTNYVLVYQEQAMAIAQAVAGFSLQDADVLRKAIGKKLPEVMAKCKTMFIEGAKKAAILSEAQAEEVFGWIEKSQRYSFNKSHSVCYGVTGYQSAYIKAHNPVAFFTAWLLHAKGKSNGLEEINELVSEAKLFDISVEVPDLRFPETHFSTDRKVIRFGFGDIKGIGDAQIIKVRDALAAGREALGKPVGDWSWLEFLVHVSDLMSASVVSRLIQVGALRYMKVGRQDMLHQYTHWTSVTKPEKAWVRAEYKGCEATLPEILRSLGRPKKEGGGCSNKNRVAIVRSLADLIENPPTAIADTPHWVAWTEEQLLGTSITCSKIDACDISAVNTSCKEFLAGKTGYLMFGAVVKLVREVRTKKGKSAGKHMAFMSLDDGSCCLGDVVCFPDVWQEAKSMLFEGNTVILHGERDQKSESQLVVKKVWQAA